MATQSVGAGPQEVKRRRELIEALAPEMLKFTRQGQEVTGTLINMEPITVKGQNGQQASETIEYTLMQDNATRTTFLGTNDLNKKIHPGMIGHYLAIRYERDDDSFTRPGQSAAKIFKVLVSKEKEPGY